MRGKKESDDILSQLENLYEIEDYDSNFLKNLQNERQLLNDIQQLSNLEQVPNYFYKDDEKRVPSSSGFFGMRGKKQMDDTDNAYDLMDKRVPSAGFFGMRGKKWIEDDLTMGEDKRVPMGFQGN